MFQTFQTFQTHWNPFPFEKFGQKIVPGKNIPWYFISIGKIHLTLILNFSVFQVLGIKDTFNFDPQYLENTKIVAELPFPPHFLSFKILNSHSLSVTGFPSPLAFKFCPKIMWTPYLFNNFLPPNHDISKSYTSLER